MFPQYGFWAITPGKSWIMRTEIKTILFIIVTLCACNTPDGNEKAAIAAVMDAQVKAWNEGDLEEYMQGYWHSDSLIFTGGKGITQGWDAALARYKKAYGGREAMGRLSFAEVHTKLIGRDGAYTVGQWRLDRSTDTLTGRFTLIWNKLKTGQWVIVADHSS